MSKEQYIVLRTIEDPHVVTADEPFTFDDVRWSEQQQLNNPDLWERNVTTVRTLFENGGVPIKIVESDMYPAVPMTYDFDGVLVEFLPHWGYYKVGELCFTVPATDADTLRADLSAARALQDAKDIADAYVNSRNTEQA